MRGFLNWINRPFPLGTQLSRHILISFLFGSFVFGFMMIFKPFSNLPNETPLWITYLGFGIITTSVLIGNFILFAFFLKKWLEPDRFTVGGALLLSLWNICIITLANWLYFRFGPYHQAEIPSLLYFLGATLSIGIFPTVIFFFWFERIYFIRYSTRAENISGQIKTSDQNIDSIEIMLFGEGKSDKLLLQSSDIICMKSEGNYVTIFHRSDKLTERTMLRGSLKAFEQQMAGHSQFIRCHQSYIINKQLLQNISGNARGYLLELRNLDMKVPVSRQFQVSRLSQI